MKTVLIKKYLKLRDQLVMICDLNVAKLKVSGTDSVKWFLHESWTELCNIVIPASRDFVDKLRSTSKDFKFQIGPTFPEVVQTSNLILAYYFKKRKYVRQIHLFSDESASLNDDPKFLTFVMSEFKVVVTVGSYLHGAKNAKDFMLSIGLKPELSHYFMKVDSPACKYSLKGGSSSGIDKTQSPDKKDAQDKQPRNNLRNTTVSKESVSTEMFDQSNSLFFEDISTIEEQHSRKQKSCTSDASVWESIKDTNNNANSTSSFKIETKHESGQAEHETLYSASNIDVNSTASRELNEEMYETEAVKTGSKRIGFFRAKLENEVKRGQGQFTGVTNSDIDVEEDINISGNAIIVEIDKKDEVESCNFAATHPEMITVDTRVKGLAKEIIANISSYSASDHGISANSLNTHDSNERENSFDETWSRERATANRINCVRTVHDNHRETNFKIANRQLHFSPTYGSKKTELSPGTPKDYSSPLHKNENYQSDQISSSSEKSNKKSPRSLRDVRIRRNGDGSLKNFEPKEEKKKSKVNSSPTIEKKILPASEEKSAVVGRSQVSSAKICATDDEPEEDWRSDVSLVANLRQNSLKLCSNLEQMQGSCKNRKNRKGNGKIRSENREGPIDSRRVRNDSKALSERTTSDKSLVLAADTFPMASSSTESATPTSSTNSTMSSTRSILNSNMFACSTSRDGSPPINSAKVSKYSFKKTSSCVDASNVRKLPKTSKIAIENQTLDDSDLPSMFDENGFNRKRKSESSGDLDRSIRPGLSLKRVRRIQPQNKAILPISDFVYESLGSKINGGINGGKAESIRDKGESAENKSESFGEKNDSIGNEIEPTGKKAKLLKAKSDSIRNKFEQIPNQTQSTRNDSELIKMNTIDDDIGFSTPDSPLENWNPSTPLTISDDSLPEFGILDEAFEPEVTVAVPEDDFMWRIPPPELSQGRTVSKALSTRYKTTIMPQKIDKSDAWKIREEIRNTYEIKNLTKDHIHYLLVENKRYLKDIMQGNNFSQRHETFKKGGRARNDLNHQIHTTLFTEEQLDQIALFVLSVFCKKGEKYKDYILKVLIPEAMIKIVMDAQSTTYFETESLMRQAIFQ